ncbi:MAG: ABC transporter ATP-binding protein [Gammaproteobacteria bacterium]
MNPPVVELNDLYKTYREGGRERQVLRGANLTLNAGEFVLLVGRSGSGKSTLLNLISGIDRPDQGRIVVDGCDITALGETERTLYRRRRVGFVYQFFNLIPHLTVWENVVLPLELEGGLEESGRRRASRLLEAVGLAERGESFPDRLSGGEQQRVAIARALVTDPAILLADEPTGNLDQETGIQVLELLHQLVRGGRHTVLMVTHGQEAEPYADRQLRLREGRIEGIAKR